MLLELLGLTPEQIAKGETWSATDGERNRDTGDKIGDKVMSILTGTDYASEVEKATKGRYLKKMTRLYGDDIEDVSSVAGYKAIGDLTKLEPEQIKREIERRKATRAARGKRSALTGEDPGSLDPTITDPGTIVAGGSKVVKDENTAETRRLEGREDNRIALQLELARQDRRDDREARRDERAYQNRKLDMQEARLDRKDRQAAIQQMMAGLAQMGASIAI